MGDTTTEDTADTPTEDTEEDTEVTAMDTDTTTADTTVDPTVIKSFNLISSYHHSSRRCRTSGNPIWYYSLEAEKPSWTMIKEERLKTFLHLEKYFYCESAGQDSLSFVLS